MKRETDRHVLNFFRSLLELKEPWRVVAVELQDEERSVEIEVEWADIFFPVLLYKTPCFWENNGATSNCKQLPIKGMSIFQDRLPTTDVTASGARWRDRPSGQLVDFH
jgi:hypothetical protein